VPLAPDWFDKPIDATMDSFFWVSELLQFGHFWVLRASEKDTILSKGSPHDLHIYSYIGMNTLL